MAGAGATLYIIATPIGNLGDLSPRARECLQSANVIYAEDTRRTRQLLSHLGITGKTLARLDSHTDTARAQAIVDSFGEGEAYALVSDAGTPVVSDPGQELVGLAVAKGVSVCPIPGASAVLVAAVGSGLVNTAFRFLGFLPRSGRKRDETLATIAQTPEAVILFESPQRTQKTLSDLARLMPGRQGCVARELTKMHEEFQRGSLDDLSKTESWRGEITIVIGPRVEVERDEASLWQAVDAAIMRGLQEGKRPKTIAALVSAEFSVPKRKIYARVIAAKE